MTLDQPENKGLSPRMLALILTYANQFAFTEIFTWELVRIR